MILWAARAVSILDLSNLPVTRINTAEAEIQDSDEGLANSTSELVSVQQEFS